MINNYRQAIRKLQLTLARQQASVEATQGQIAGFEALVKQLEGGK